MSLRGMWRQQRCLETPSPRHPSQCPPPLPSQKPVPTYVTPRISPPDRWKYPTRKLRCLLPLPRSLAARTLPSCRWQAGVPSSASSLSTVY
eukprot:2142517-Pleurochrysis_carterae.AAC.1